jgi:hypothetical protein
VGWIEYLSINITYGHKSQIIDWLVLRHKLTLILYSDNELEPWLTCKLKYYENNTFS